jgi:uncharacterized protein (TIGR02996 family)
MTDREQQEYQGFVDAIIAEPAEDAIRLICADWLEDHGEPERAEFVRMQIEMFQRCQKERCDYCRLGQHTNGPCRCTLEYRRLTGRSDYLRFRLEHSLYGLKQWNGHVYDLTWKWSRGFLSELSCPWKVFERVGPRLARMNPLERVTLTDWRIVESRREIPGMPCWTFSYSRGNSVLNIDSRISNVYESREEALIDVSAVCLDWARKRGVFAETVERMESLRRQINALSW